MLSSSSSSSIEIKPLINYPESITTPEIILKCFQYYPLMFLRRNLKDFNDYNLKENKILLELKNSNYDNELNLRLKIRSDLPYKYFLNYQLTFNEFKKLCKLGTNILAIYFNVYDKFVERELILKGNKNHDTEFNKIFTNKNKTKVNLLKANDYFKVYHSDYLLLNEAFNGYLIKQLIDNETSTSSKSILANTKFNQIKKQIKNDKLINNELIKQNDERIKQHCLQFKLNNNLLINRKDNNQNIISIDNLNNKNHQLIDNNDNNKINQSNELNNDYFKCENVKQFIKDNHILDEYTQILSKRNNFIDKDSLMVICKNLCNDNVLNNQLDNTDQLNYLNQQNKLNQINISNQKNTIIQKGANQVKRSLSEQQINKSPNQQKTIIQLNSSYRYAQSVSYSNLNSSFEHENKKIKLDKDNSIYVNHEQKIFQPNLNQQQLLKSNQQLINLNQQQQQLLRSNQQQQLSNQQQQLLRLNQQQQLLRSNQQHQLLRSNQQQQFSKFNQQQLDQLKLKLQQQKYYELIVKDTIGYKYINTKLAKQIYDYLEINKDKNYKQLDLNNPNILFNLPMDKFIMIYNP